VYDDERPRAGWADILLLAERLAPTPSLLPADAADRALVFGLSHELCGEEGLAWSRRLQLVHAGLHGAGGFPERVAKYLGKKYGYRPEAGAAAGARVAQLLDMLAARLKAQRSAGSPYYLGDAMTAADIYAATASPCSVPYRLPSARWTRRRGRRSSCAMRRPRRRWTPCSRAPGHDVRKASCAAAAALTG
jgi:glutathione S-transferase